MVEKREAQGATLVEPFFSRRSFKTRLIRLCFPPETTKSQDIGDMCFALTRDHELRLLRRLHETGEHLRPSVLLHAGGSVARGCFAVRASLVGHPDIFGAGESRDATRNGVEQSTSPPLSIRLPRALRLFCRNDQSYRNNKRRLAALRSEFAAGLDHWEIGFVTNAINELVAYPEADLPD